MPIDPLAGERGGQLRASTGNAKGSSCRNFQSQWSRPTASSTSLAAWRDVARARECPPFPKCTRLVPAKCLNLAITGNTRRPFAGLLCKPSDGLGPSIPSLPCAAFGNRSQPTATVLAYWCRLPVLPICARLPPVATTGLHKRLHLCCFCWRHPPRCQRPLTSEPRVKRDAVRFMIEESEG